MVISSRFSALPPRPALLGKAQLEHVGYGTMNGADGKPFKTRAGGVMKLYDLIAMAEVEAKSRLAEQGWVTDYSAGGARRDRQARSASPPSNSPISPITAPRIISSTLSASPNSRARPVPICNMRRCASSPSCARRAEEGHERACPPFIRRRNAIWCCSFFRWAMCCMRRKTKRAPNILCDYAFTLAQNFSRFYAAHHILSETDTELRGHAAGALRAGAGGVDPHFGSSGHRGSRKNVNKSRGLRLRVDLSVTPTYDARNMRVRREAPALGQPHDPSRERPSHRGRRRSNRPGNSQAKGPRGG